MVVGTSCVAIPMVLNGAIGAKLHIPFSVVVRSGFGYYFGYFCIISRSILAMFWLGIQGANGAQCITIMLAVSRILITLYIVRADADKSSVGYLAFLQPDPQLATLRRRYYDERHDLVFSLLDHPITATPDPTNAPEVPLHG
jgi:hypothetical protein